MKIYRMTKILLVAYFLYSGCASYNPLKQYPNFVTEKEYISNCYILTDLIITKAGKKDTLVIDVFEGKKIGKILTDSIKYAIVKKGYSVGKTIPTSVGRFINKQLFAKVIEMEEQESINYKDLPLKSAPFFIDSTYEDTTINNAIRRNSEYDTSKDSINFIESGIKPIIYVSIQGKKVPVGQSILEGVATGILTLGMVSVYSVSYFVVHIWLVDFTTSKIIWSDSSYNKGDTPDQKSIIKTVLKLIQKIPEKYEQVKV